MVLTSFPGSVGHSAAGGGRERTRAPAVQSGLGARRTRLSHDVGGVHGGLSGGVVALSEQTAEKRPPGPTNIPLLGRALELDPKQPDRTFLRWQRQYGAIYSVKLGVDTVVVLSDAALIREAFSKAASTGRPKGGLFEMLGVERGLILSTGELWHVTRRFALFHLRNFGMGKARLEEVIREQVDDFLAQVVAPNEGCPLDIDKSLDIAVVNIVWGIAASETLGITDERVLNIMNKGKELTEKTKRFNWFAFLPVLFKILPKSLTQVDVVLELFGYARKHLIMPVIEEHRRRFDPTAEPRDFIDCFLLEQRKDPHHFTDEGLVQTIRDMFNAGSDTTATTLRWIFCCLCARPAAQRRVQAEIDAVVGGSRPPSLADRQRMPFTDAFIMETQRLADIAPMGVMHVAEAAFELGGYTVPRGAAIAALFPAVHKDPRNFPDPWTFRPERFLDADGKLQPSKALMPFSVGKRSCLGEAMARSELFLFTTVALQRYNFALPAGCEHDLSRADAGGLASPVPYKVVATRR
ncbi:cytochrome P450 2B2-like [Pollicipes pollicipes]|uniref:cytochrome P450 2B2-like n=1 Tax=Pollicipes pollicipes TaxID=41117 RepID=UPI00188586B8|nr:cytochrome P450 2B2-like [Pollicipes pollicipes]